MSFTTDSDSTEDFGIPFRRPISVAQLLEREGFRPADRTRATRRALTGVAAGAVLTVGAVVGSLFLNHGQTAPRDTLASGSQSGGDIVLSEGNQQGTIVSPAMPHRAAPAAPRAAGHVTDGGATDRAKGAVGNAPIAAAPKMATAPAQPSTPAVQSAPVMAPASTPAVSPSTSPTANTSTATVPSAPAAIPTTTPAASAPATTTPPATATPPATTDPAAPPTTGSAAPTTTPAPAHTGLLGGLAGILGHVEHPAFSWFG